MYSSCIFNSLCRISCLSFTTNLYQPELLKHRYPHRSLEIYECTVEENHNGQMLIYYEMRLLDPSYRCLFTLCDRVPCLFNVQNRASLSRLTSLADPRISIAIFSPRLIKTTWPFVQNPSFYLQRINLSLGNRAFRKHEAAR